MSALTIGLLAGGYVALLVVILSVLAMAKRADEAVQQALDAAEDDGTLARRFDRSQAGREEQRGRVLSG